jgi:hypothetical protein
MVLLPAWWSAGAPVRFLHGRQWVVGYLCSPSAAGAHAGCIVWLPLVGLVRFRPRPGRFFIFRSGAWHLVK